MALNPNIILQGQQPQITQPNPIDQYSKGLQLKTLLGQNQIQQQGLADDQSQRQALTESGGDPAAYLKALASGGNYKAYQAALKAQQDQQKVQADIAHVNAQTGQATAATQKTQQEVKFNAATQHAQKLSMVQSPQDAVQYIDEGIDQGVFPASARDKMLQNLSASPSLDAWKAQSAQGAIPVLERFKQDAENSRNQLNNLTSRQNNESTNATTQRGQNLNDARQREANTMNMSKPFEVSAQDGSKVLVQQDKQGNITPVQGYLPKSGTPKALTDSQSKAALFGSRMQASGDILDQLSQQGINKSIPGSQIGYGVGTVVNALSPADFQKLDQAKRDFVNATLRRESGAAIADSEFDNANKQYFPQQGDSKAVIEQKRQNRQIATRGVQAEIPNEQREGLVNQIIGNQSSSQKGGMATPIKTADDYAKLPSGTTYIDPSGQTRRKP